MQMMTILLFFTLVCGVAGQSQDLPAKPAGEFFPLRAADHEKTASFQRGQPVVGTTYFYGSSGSCVLLS